MLLKTNEKLNVSVFVFVGGDVPQSKKQTTRISSQVHDCRKKNLKTYLGNEL